MSNEEASELFDALNQLLDDERETLLKGKLDALDPLLQRKETLFSEILTLEDQPKDRLATLRAKSQRNQVLLESALQGIRAVSDRMKILRRVKGSLETYNNQGQRQAVDLSAGRKVEKRA